MTRRAVALAVDKRAVEWVDVLGVALDGWAWWADWAAVPGPTLRTLAGADALAVVDLVAALPAGNQMRCFLPTYGLRVHGHDGVIAETALCFRCHNAVTLASGVKRWFGFDADSEEATRLLTVLRQ